MANPVQTGTFDSWITDRIPFATGAAKTGEAGSFDNWITDRIPFADYTEADAAPSSSPVPVFMATYRRRRS